LDRLSVEFNDEAWFVVAAELSELWCFNFGDGGGANDNDDDDDDAAGDAVNFDDGEDVWVEGGWDEDELGKNEWGANIDAGEGANFDDDAEYGEDVWVEGGWGANIDAGDAVNFEGGVLEFVTEVWHGWLPTHDGDLLSDTFKACVCCSGCCHTNAVTINVAVIITATIPKVVLLIKF
jgi:hypothetical protein